MHAAGWLCVTKNVSGRWLALLVCALPLAAGEYAILATGALLYADRYELVGDAVRIYKGEGWIELPRSLVQRFEPADSPAPAPQPGPGPAAAPPKPENLVRTTGVRLGGDEFAALLESVAKVESGYRQDAVSPKGARGLMQLMPETARQLEADPDNPVHNVEAGARLLRDLLLKYKDHPHQLRLALAAYNAGPGAVERYGGVPPFRETVQYVERVLAEFRRASIKKASSASR